MNFNVVIPARYESTRLPGKPLLDLVGQTMIQRVVKQAMKSQAASVLVATDDSRIQESVRVAGAEALLTSAAHTSGSDRVMEVAENLGWNDSAIVVNVQGDEPLIPPSVIDQVAKILVFEQRSRGRHAVRTDRASRGCVQSEHCQGRTRQPEHCDVFLPCTGSLVARLAQE